MTTTALFVEILVIGAVAELWLAVLIVPMQPGFSADRLFALFSQAKDAQAPAAIVALAVTYAVGWVLNFAAERILKRFFQKGVRDAIFGSSEAYNQARLNMLQHGSAALVNDVLIDRHIIRISRAGALNFFCLAMALLIHAIRGLAPCLLCALAVISAVLAVGSFFQWRTRYESHYTRIAAISNLHLETKPATKPGA